MGEVRLLCSQRARGGYRFLHAEVRGVRAAAPECVEHEYAHAPQRVERLLVEPFRARDIAQAARAGAEAALGTVCHRDRQQLEAGGDDRLARLELVHLEVGPTGTGWRMVPRIEDVIEAGAHLPGRDRMCEDGQRPCTLAREHTQVIDAVHVVGMRVREPDRINAANPVPQQLDPQLGWCVDQECAAVALEKCGMSRTVVARVARRAGITRAADDGHAERGAGPEKAQSHSTSTRSMLVVPGTWNGTPAVTTTRWPGCAMRVRNRYSRPTSSIAS